MKQPSLTEQLSEGIVPTFHHLRHKRDPHICPRCMKRAVRRDMRKCGHCQGTLLFPGDDALRITEDWFMWHRSIFGLEGFYHRSYFTGSQLTVPEGGFF